MKSRRDAPREPRDTSVAVNRRRVLKASALLPAALAGCGSEGTKAPDPSESHFFRHGVASGDPLPDAVILWTRVTRTIAESITVSWEISAERTFLTVMLTGSAETSAERDFTVKVDARGLQPG